MTTLRKEVDFKEVLSKAGFSASIEAPIQNDLVPASITQRHPDVLAFESRFAETLVKGGEVAIALNPRGVRVLSQLPP